MPKHIQAIKFVLKSNYKYYVGNLLNRMLPIRDFPSSKKFPYLVLGLIVVNVVMFIYQQTLPNVWDFYTKYAFTPIQLTEGNWFSIVTLFTSQFLHGGYEHIIFNMWFLWIFADNVEEDLGSFKFLLFYLMGGVAAGLLQYAFDFNNEWPILGASGSISAVLGYYLLRFPHYKVQTIVFFGPGLIPADIFLGLWFILQFVSGIASLGIAGDAGGVAWWAHIGGFVFGMAIAKIYLKPHNSYEK